MTNGLRQSILAGADLLEAVVNLGQMALEEELDDARATLARAGAVAETAADPAFALLGDVLNRGAELVNAVRYAVTEGAP